MLIADGVRETISRPTEYVSGAGLTVVHVVEGCQGGVGTVVRNLIDSQAADPDVSSIHLFADPQRLGDMLEGASAIRHNYESSRNPLRILGVARALTERLQAIRPDAVFLHSTFPGVYGRVFTNQDKHWATIYCAHGWAFTQKVPGWKKRVYSFIERRLAVRSDAVVSVSFSEFDQAVSQGISPPLHRVIYHGLQPRQSSPGALEDVDSRCLNIGFVGRFDRQKGVDLLLEVAAQKQMEHIHFWLVGGDTLGDALSVPDKPNIHALGWIPNQEIDACIRRFDAVVIPSRWEGFGLVALEAMRNAKPVIATRVGGLPELIIDGVNGLLIAPDDAGELERVLLGLSKGELARMGALALEVFTAGFEWDQCYAHWRQLLAQTLSERASPVSIRPSRVLYRAAGA